MQLLIHVNTFHCSSESWFRFPKCFIVEANQVYFRFGLVLFSPFPFCCFTVFSPVACKGCDVISIFSQLYSISIQKQLALILKFILYVCLQLKIVKCFPGSKEKILETSKNTILQQNKNLEERGDRNMSKWKVLVVERGCLMGRLI